MGVKRSEISKFRIIRRVFRVEVERHVLGLAGFELSGLCHAICRAMQSHRAKNVPHDFSRQLSVKVGQTELMSSSSMVNMHGTRLYVRSNGADPTEIRMFPYFRVLAYMGKSRKMWGNRKERAKMS